MSQAASGVCGPLTALVNCAHAIALQGPQAFCTIPGWTR